MFRFGKRYFGLVNHGRWRKPVPAHFQSGADRSAARQEDTATQANAAAALVTDPKHDKGAWRAGRFEV